MSQNPEPPKGEEHNPDNLTPAQVGDGWRLLRKGENPDHETEWFNNVTNQWLPYGCYTGSEATYRRRIQPPPGEEHNPDKLTPEFQKEPEVMFAVYAMQPGTDMGWFPQETSASEDDVRYWCKRNNERKQFEPPRIYVAVKKTTTYERIDTTRIHPPEPTTESVEVGSNSVVPASGQTEKPKDGRICHAPGDRCFGCPHYHGKADVCSYAPEPTEPAKVGSAEQRIAEIRREHDCGCEVCASTAVVCTASASTYAEEIDRQKQRIAELTEENAKLREELARLAKDREFHRIGEETLTAQLAEAKRDSQRLEKVEQIGCLHTEYEQGSTVYVLTVFPDGAEDPIEYRGATLRAASDAASTQPPKQ